MVLLLSLGAALLIGVGDIFGSLAGRRGRVLATTLWVFITSAFPIILLALAWGGSARPFDYLLGAIAGIGGGLGLLSLYAGYSRAAVGIVAPVSAVVGVVLPVSVGLAVGDRAGPLALVGVVVGMVAIALIGWRPDVGAVGTRRAAVGFGLAAGLSFGVMASVLGLTQPESNLLPLIPTRILSALLMVAIASTVRLPVLPVRPSWRYIPWAALCSAGGIALYTTAAQQNLTIAGLLLQMAYGVTALLAIVIFSERPTPSQSLGFAAAAASVALIALG